MCAGSALHHRANLWPPRSEYPSYCTQGSLLRLANRPQGNVRFCNETLTAAPVPCGFAAPCLFQVVPGLQRAGAAQRLRGV